jgi:hypothetical protein
MDALAITLVADRAIARLRAYATEKTSAQAPRAGQMSLLVLLFHNYSR